MVRAENIEGKIAYTRQILIKLARYQKLSIQEIQTNQDLTGAVERYLFLAAQSCIDTIEMFCKLKKLGKAESMSDSVGLLEKAGTIDEILGSKLRRMVGFRNFLSHGYEFIDYKIVEEVLHNGLADIESLISTIENHL